MNDHPMIHFVVTGGSIDSYYDGSRDQEVTYEHSILPRYLDTLKIPNELDFTEVCMKDSRDLTKEDRQRILEAVEATPAKHVIITHGTYTLPDTAEYLEKHLKRKDQVVLLTASLMPIDGRTFSDAPFNLGFSVAKVTGLEPGIYISLHGKIFKQSEINEAFLAEV